jgi:hypothetical protein
VLRFHLVAILLVVTLSPSAHAVPIQAISNGGFETTTVGPPASFPLNQVPSWNGSASTFVLGTGNPGNAAVLGPIFSDSISQDIDTLGYPFVEVKFQYQISSLDPLFPLGNQGPDILTVSLGGYQVGTFELNDPPLGGPSIGPWTSFTTGVIPAALLGGGNNFTLTFSLPNSGTGESTVVQIDNVSVLLTPEPTTLALFGMATLTAGYLGLRRRKTAAA